MNKTNKQYSLPVPPHPNMHISDFTVLPINSGF